MYKRLRDLFYQETQIFLQGKSGIHRNSGFERLTYSCYKAPHSGLRIQHTISSTFLRETHSATALLVFYKNTVLTLTKITVTIVTVIKNLTKLKEKLDMISLCTLQGFFKDSWHS